MSNTHAVGPIKSSLLSVRDGTKDRSQFRRKQSTMMFDAHYVESEGRDKMVQCIMSPELIPDEKLQSINHLVPTDSYTRNDGETVVAIEKYLKMDTPLTLKAIENILEVVQDIRLSNSQVIKRIRALFPDLPDDKHIHYWQGISAYIKGSIDPSQKKKKGKKDRPSVIDGSAEDNMSANKTNSDDTGSGETNEPALSGEMSKSTGSAESGEVGEKPAIEESKESVRIKESANTIGGTRSRDSRWSKDSRASSELFLSSDSTESEDSRENIENRQNIMGVKEGKEANVEKIESKENICNTEIKESEDTRESRENMATRESAENMDSKVSKESVIYRKRNENSFFMDNRRHIQQLMKRESKESVISRQSKESVISRQSKESVISRKSKDSVIRRKSKEKLVNRESKEKLVNRESKESVRIKESSETVGIRGVRSRESRESRRIRESRETIESDEIRESIENIESRETMINRESRDTMDNRESRETMDNRESRDMIMVQESSPTIETRGARSKETKASSENLESLKSSEESTENKAEIKISSEFWLRSPQLASPVPTVTIDESKNSSNTPVRDDEDEDNDLPEGGSRETLRGKTISSHSGKTNSSHSDATYTSLRIDLNTLSATDSESETDEETKKANFYRKASIVVSHISAAKSRTSGSALSVDSLSEVSIRPSQRDSFARVVKRIIIGVTAIRQFVLKAISRTGYPIPSTDEYESSEESSTELSPGASRARTPPKVRASRSGSRTNIRSNSRDASRHVGQSETSLVEDQDFLDRHWDGYEDEFFDSFQMDGDGNYRVRQYDSFGNEYMVRFDSHRASILDAEGRVISRVFETDRTSTDRKFFDQFKREIINVPVLNKFNYLYDEEGVEMVNIASEPEPNNKLQVFNQEGEQVIFVPAVTQTRKFYDESGNFLGEISATLPRFYNSAGVELINFPDITDPNIKIFDDENNAVINYNLYSDDEGSIYVEDVDESIMTPSQDMATRRFFNERGEVLGSISGPWSQSRFYDENDRELVDFPELTDPNLKIFDEEMNEVLNYSHCKDIGKIYNEVGNQVLSQGSSRNSPTQSAEVSPDASRKPSNIYKIPSGSTRKPSSVHRMSSNPYRQSSELSREHSGLTRKPSDPSRELSDISRKPSDPNRIPVDISQKTSDPSWKPADIPRKTSDPSWKPSDITRKPSDPNRIPSDISWKPSDPNWIPSDISRKPSDPNRIPSDISRKTSEPSWKPSDMSQASSTATGKSRRIDGIPIVSSRKTSISEKPRNRSRKILPRDKDVNITVVSKDKVCDSQGREIVTIPMELKTKRPLFTGKGTPLNKYSKLKAAEKGHKWKRQSNKSSVVSVDENLQQLLLEKSKERQLELRSKLLQDELRRRSGPKDNTVAAAAAIPTSRAKPPSVAAPAAVPTQSRPHPSEPFADAPRSGDLVAQSSSLAAQTYMQKHGIYDLFEMFTNNLVMERPTKPIDYLLGLIHDISVCRQRAVPLKQLYERVQGKC